MTPVPVLTLTELVSLIVLYRIDTETRDRGQHSLWRHHDGRTTTVPEHDDRPISPTLVRLIAGDLEMSVEDFLDGR
jgi:hypothetical protein